MVKSPRTAKIPVKNTRVKVTKKKDEVQLTLETAFEAGKLYREAKELKQKALMGQNVIQVSFGLHLILMNSIFSFESLKFGNNFFGKEPVFQNQRSLGGKFSNIWGKKDEFDIIIGKIKVKT